ncbi:DUF3060 domain-containing protein [Tahibacter amnicola]|uniref:DUF3060 domain-containing protein n=1 Tax=Tahibacter amnicola TaxID=2976241 RepID=A0ABY6BAT5_9GAMM|nr:DUF3060 domain-containing protein [Tahibacter amnicola]UXI67178.1 DUF3060 domain-containing protein [Tahibacter amnicola]
MKTFACSVLALAGLLVAQASVAQSDNPDGKIEQNNNKAVTHNCGEAGSLSLVGSGNEVTVTGECTLVAIKGGNNTVRINRVSQINVDGDGNQVSWVDGTGPGNQATSKVAGRNNVVTQEKPVEAH